MSLTEGQVSGNPVWSGHWSPAWWTSLSARHKHFELLVGLCLFEIAFYFAYKYCMLSTGSAASPFWIPDSLLLCALLRSHPRYWGLFVLAPLPIRFFSEAAANVPFWFLAGTYGIDSLKGLAAAWVVRRLTLDPSRLSSRQDWLAFLAILLVAAAMAFPGAALRQALGDDYWQSWQQFFVGDALAQIVITPALLTWLFWKGLPVARIKTGTIIEAGILFVGLILATWLAFYSDSPLLDFLEARFFLPVPFLFWAAIRFGVSGAAVAIPVIALFALSSATLHMGAFAHYRPDVTAFALQQFLLLRSVPVYLVAGLVEQRHRTELSLREGEERFRTMANIAPVMLWMSSTDKLCNFFNQVWLDFTGRPLEAELGNGWAEGVHPDDLEHCLATYNTAFDARRPFRMEYRLRHQDGQYHWIVDIGVPRFDPDNVFCGYIGSAIDITDQKKAQEDSAHIVHLQRLALMGELTTSIAHELRQPLSAITLHAQTIKMLLRASGSASPAIKEILADVEKDIQRANNVLSGIRDFVRKRQVQFENLDLNATIRDCHSLILSELSRRHVTIKMNLADNLPSVRGEPTQIMQVLLNLVTNGMEAMEDLPRAQRVLTLRTEQRDDAVEISVMDCGRGIAPEDQSNLFKSFFTTRESGMGLGLSIVWTIILAHHGRVWAENIPSGGAAFHFTLPIAAATD